MELSQIIELLKSPEKVSDLGEINNLCSYLSGFITDLEMEIDERNYQVSVKHYGLMEELKTIAKADRAIEMTPEYRDREKAKLKLNQLKRLRADLKDKFRVITQTKGY